MPDCESLLSLSANDRSMMAIPLGRPMFIDLKLCTITAPEDCATPIDRSSRIPVPRTEGEKPTVLSERLYRVQMTSRYRDIRALEIEGPIPKDPEKVKELHHYAKRFKKSLPPFFRASNPDTRWDLDNPFVPAQREMLSYLCDSFILALHRPYICKFNLLSLLSFDQSDSRSMWRNSWPVLEVLTARNLSISI